MSTLQIGQLRKSSQETYSTPVLYRVADVETPQGAMSFIDKAILINENKFLENGKSYYLKFSINRLAKSEQKISIYLKLSSGTSRDEKQLLKTYTIDKGNPQDAIPFDLIIAPVSNFDEIVFELQRTSDDYGQLNRNRTYGRQITLQVQKFTELINVLDKIGHAPLRNVGVQGPTGMLMSINGEEIRIGRTGIYELIYNIPIDFIGFVVQDKKQVIDNSDIKPKDYFILDYQYKQ